MCTHLHDSRWKTAAIVQHARGLAASPLARYSVKVGGVPGASGAPPTAQSESRSAIVLARSEPALRQYLSEQHRPSTLHRSARRRARHLPGNANETIVCASASFAR